MPTDKETILLLPDVAWPLMKCNLQVALQHMTLFPEQAVVSGGYVVPAKEGGVHLCYGGFNMWLDNQCCTGGGLSALQGKVIHIEERNVWGDGTLNLISMPEEVSNVLDEANNRLASRNRTLDPVKSGFPHVREYAPKFRALTRIEAERWFSGVLCGAVVSSSSRPFKHCVDKTTGHMRTRLQFMRAASASGASPAIVTTSLKKREVYGGPGYLLHENQVFIPQYRSGVDKDQHVVIPGCVARTRAGGSALSTLTIVSSKNLDTLTRVPYELDHRGAMFRPAPVSAHNRSALIVDHHRQRPWRVAVAATSGWTYGTIITL